MLFARLRAYFEAAKAARYKEFAAHQARISAMMAETDREQWALDSIRNTRELTDDEQERYDHNEQARIAQHKMRAQPVKAPAFTSESVSSSTSRQRPFPSVKVA